MTILGIQFMMLQLLKKLRLMTKPGAVLVDPPGWLIRVSMF